MDPSERRIEDAGPEDEREIPVEDIDVAAVGDDNPPPIMSVLRGIASMLQMLSCSRSSTHVGEDELHRELDCHEATCQRRQIEPEAGPYHVLDPQRFV